VTALVGNPHNIERFATCAIRKGLKKIPRPAAGGFPRQRISVNIGLPRSVNAPNFFFFPGLTAGVSETGEMLTLVVSEVFTKNFPSLTSHGFSETEETSGYIIPLHNCLLVEVRVS